MQMRIAFPGGRRVSAEFGGFEVTTDQSVKDGGEAKAPTPFELFLSSLGTCAGFYVLAYCQARKIPVDGIELRQNDEWDKDGHRLSRVHLSIELPSSFPSQFRDGVRRAAEACAVKKTIVNPPEIVVEIGAVAE
ncbi:MAG: OsmC family protein [Pseudomonadota bacterium]